MELRAVTEEAWRAVRHADRGAVVVGDAKTALMVAHDELEVARTPQLVVVEAEEMPVVVWERVHVLQLARALVDAHAARSELNDLSHIHHVRSKRAGRSDPQDSWAAIVDHRREPE